MRIALIASGFADYSMELAGALARDHQVLALADARTLAQERPDMPAPDGVALVRWGQTGRLERWSAVAALGLRLARWRPDVVLAHEHAHPHLTALLRLALRTAPLGLIVHDPEPHPGRDTVFAARRAGEIAAQRGLATWLFAHGPSCTRRLSGLGGRAVVDIAHGPLLRPSTPPRPPPGERRLLVFGRMEAYKGLEVLLQAVRRLQDAGAAVRLELRGAGPELGRLADAFRAVPGCTIHNARASRAELLQALAACDLVVAPYLHASASGVAAAAMANARGLVASEVGGLAEMVRPGVSGLRVAPGDPAALAETILRALPQAAPFGQGAQQLAQGPFAWSVAAQAIAGAIGGCPGRYAA